jgi:hypothetical protein
MIFWRSWVITEAVTAITGIARVRGQPARAAAPVPTRRAGIALVIAGGDPLAIDTHDEGSG